MKGRVWRWLRRGACGAKPVVGGYDHWFCQKPASHIDRPLRLDKSFAYGNAAHRFNNYTWHDGGTHYAPIPHDVDDRTWRA